MARPPGAGLPAVPDLLHDRNVQFWALNAAGLLAWGSSAIASGIYRDLHPAYDLAVLTGIVTGLLLTGLLRELFCQGVWSTRLWKRLPRLSQGVDGVVGATSVANRSPTNQ